MTKRLKASGCNVIGRTTMPEFGAAASSDSVLYGTTRNPWNLDRSSGGSSAGTAVAVATGMVPIGTGSDGSGSIRHPAACCGVVGLKPSRGRVTWGPRQGESLLGLAAQFGLSRTVRDTAALLDALHAPAPGDPFAIARPVRPYREEVGAQPGRLRLGVITSSWTGMKVRREATRAVRQVAARCETMGHFVDDVNLDIEINTNDRAMWLANLTMSFDRVAKDMGRRVSAATLEPVNLEAYYRGREVAATAVLGALDGWNTLRRNVAGLFDRFDLLLMPTMTGPAPDGRYASTSQPISYDGWRVQDEEACSFTQLFNITGTPAISLPLHQSDDGLPVGVQVAGPFGDEAILIRVASALEEAMPWSDRLPPVHASQLAS
jgi:amidase